MATGKNENMRFFIHLLTLLNVILCLSYDFLGLITENYNGLCQVKLLENYLATNFKKNAGIKLHYANVNMAGYLAYPFVCFWRSY